MADDDDTRIGTETGSGPPDTGDASGGGDPGRGGDAELEAMGFEELGVELVGGMGVVRKVRERGGLERVLAIKTVRRGGGGLHAVQRFEAEKLLTARLRHAGVVPVFDAGSLRGGGAWFTMPWIEGHTLRVEIDRTLAARRAGDDAALDALLARLQRLCAIVGYAHGCGVVHRDLKPGNVMIDAQGDVFVLDWGIARGLGEEPGRRDGTRGYMSPEQDRGEVQGAATDVFALGVILYEAVCGARPEGSVRRPLEEVAAEAGVSVPEGLAALYTAATEADPEDRPPDAVALERRIAEWREADRRRREARKVLEASARRERAALDLQRRAEAARRQASVLERGVERWQPEETKLRWWTAAARASALELRAEIEWARFEQEVEAALALDPELGAARDALADRAFARLLDAEASGDPLAAARSLVHLERHARGPRRALLAAEGLLTLRTDRPARVEVERYEPVHGRLHPTRRPDLDFAAPVEAHRLPAGSYRLWILADGLPPVPYPVRIARGGHWRAVPPRARRDAVVRLGEAVGLGDRDRLVLGGPARLGGGDDAPEAWPVREVWVDSFVMRRDPVTGAEYLAFLRALDDAGEDVRALLDGPDALVRDADGRLCLGRSADGSALGADEPIRMVSWHAATRYAAWESARTGVEWRLPDEAEWEKAARGVDGRRYPWGDRADGAWTCFAVSHQGPPRVRAVDAFARDESPYGVRGLGGNVRDWCLNPYDRYGDHLVGRRLRPGAAPGDDTFRMVRGGSFQSVALWCLSACRFAGAPGVGLNNLGFRLARSVRSR